MHGISKQNQTAPESVYRFADFKLHPDERSLSRCGQTLTLAPKAFDALVFFLRNAGRLVRKDELMEALWPGIHVSEANLTNTIVSLRKAVGHSAIRTVSKHGYRFELSVEGQPDIAPELYAMFMRARDLTTERSLESMVRARDLYWLCIAGKPDFAPAWAWFGRCCWFLEKFSRESSIARELANAAFQRAFALEPDLPCAHQFYTPLEADTGQARRATARLLQRIDSRGPEPESFAGLVQVLRFCGLLGESLEAHARAIDLDPTASTSVPHTLFLKSEYEAAIEAYGGRTGYYLDAAAWAALGDTSRAITLLRARVGGVALSPFMSGLMRSLLALLEGRHDVAIACMNEMNGVRDAEVLVYLARHYAKAGATEAATQCLRRAQAAGFLCSCEALIRDPWLTNLRQDADFAALLTRTQELETQLRLEFATSPAFTGLSSPRTAECTR